MADTKISDLTAAAALSATDTFPIVQTPGAGPVKATPAQIKTYVETVFTSAETTAAPNGTVYVDSLTANAASTNADAVLRPKGTGALLANIPDNTATGGNKRGTYAVDWQLARNVADAVASGAYSTASGGYGHKVRGSYDVVGGGESNYTVGSATHQVICGGRVNSTSNQGNVVVGGEYNDASAAYSGIVCGYNNGTSGTYAFVGGGSDNAASATFSTIGGGNANGASGAHTVVGGGLSNSASGIQAVVGGGGANTANANSTTVSGGSTNTASGTASWIPGGYQATTRSAWGSYAYSSGQRAAQGDAQVIGQPVRQTTSAASITYLTTDAAAVSATNCMVLPVNSGCMFTATVTAVHAAGAAVGGWKIEGIARRGASGDATVVDVVTTAFANDTAIGAPTVTVIANVGGAGAGGIVIAITPANATATYWVGKLELIQGA